MRAMRAALLPFSEILRVKQRFCSCLTEGPSSFFFCFLSDLVIVLLISIELALRDRNTMFFKATEEYLFLPAREQAMLLA